MRKFFGRIWCNFFGHNFGMTFHPGGSFWCWSAGPYDSECLRCGFSSLKTPFGQECLLRSQKRDPRHPSYDPNVAFPWLKEIIK